MITRNFNLFLHAGKTTQLVIHANQYDSGEQWKFTLFNSDGTKYVPSTGAIVGIKSDNLGIINSGSVVDGKVVITETQQMTAAPGRAVFELMIDNGTHGTANFVLMVEPKPGDNADLSESDLSLIQQAIDSTSPAAIAEGVSDWMDEHLTPTTPVVDDTLTVQGAAADAKKVGDELADLKSAIESLTLGVDDNDGLLYIFVNGEKQGEGVEMDTSPKTTVTYSLLNASSTGTAKATVGGSYIASLSANSGLLISSVIVTMGNTDITSDVYNPSSKVINIPSVTAPISITVTATTTIDTITINEVDSALREKTLEVVEAVNEADSNAIQFVVLTDTHGSGNGQKSQNVVRFLLKNSRANKLFWLGDISNVSWSLAEYETFRQPLLNCADQVWATIGNHEWFANNSWTNLQEIYTDFLANKGDSLVGNPEHFYFYFDDVNSKIRYIVINTSDGSTDAVSSTQLTWLESAVQLPSAQWGIIAFSHYPLENYAENHGDSTSKTYEIRDILLGTNGYIISYFAGHRHQDYRTIIDGSFYEQVFNNDSKSAQAISVISIVPTGMVNIYRIGDGDDIEYNFRDLPTRESYSVTNNLTGCTNTNNETSVYMYRPYNGTIRADQNYSLGSVSVSMGNVDITATAYDSITHAISIDFVTGNIVITATAEYVEPVTEYNPTWLVRDETALGNFTYANTPAEIHEVFPNVMSIILKATVSVGFRSGRTWNYTTRTTGWTKHLQPVVDPTSSSVYIEKIIDGEYYYYVTATKADETQAYELWQTAINGGEISTGGGIGLNNTSKMTVTDMWILDTAVTDDVIRRLPVHASSD